MAENYPSEINDAIQRASFQYSVGNNQIRSSVESGPVKVRRTNTKRIDSINGTVRFTQLELDIFLSWYNLTLRDGTLSFNFPNPLDLPSLIEVRFNGPFVFGLAGFEAYDVPFNLEVIE